MAAESLVSFQECSAFLSWGEDIWVGVFVFVYAFVGTYGWSLALEESKGGDCENYAYLSMQEFCKINSNAGDKYKSEILNS